MAKPPSLLSEVRFGAFLVYSPRGSSQTSRRSRGWRDGIKRDQPKAISTVVEVLKKDFSRTPLGEVLGPDVTLVPAPKSAPLVEGGLWVPQRIADELVRAGLGRDVLACVRRIAPVNKSAFAGRGRRPSPREHLESMTVDRVLTRPSRVTVVDDFVTKGATLLAVASHVRDLFPDSQLRVFALVRTMGLVPEVDKIVDPCVGVITLTPWGDADREP